MQSVKEADYLRNGSAKTMMMLSKEDSNAMWESVRHHRLSEFSPLYRKLVHPHSGESIRHIPLKAYIPQAPNQHAAPDSVAGSSTARGSLRVVQGLVPPQAVNSRMPQTLGTALHSLLPKLFPSRTLAIHARPVLHGAVVPLNTRLEDLMKEAVFCDGFLHIAIIIMDVTS